MTTPYAATGDGRTQRSTPRSNGIEHNGGYATRTTGLGLLGNAQTRRDSFLVGRRDGDEFDADSSWRRAQTQAQCGVSIHTYDWRLERTDACATGRTQEVWIKADRSWAEIRPCSQNTVSGPAAQRRGTLVTHWLPGCSAIRFGSVCLEQPLARAAHTDALGRMPLAVALIARTGLTCYKSSWL